MKHNLTVNNSALGNDLVFVTYGEWGLTVKEARMNRVTRTLVRLVDQHEKNVEKLKSKLAVEVAEIEQKHGVNNG